MSESNLRELARKALAAADVMKGDVVLGDPIKLELNNW